MKKLISLINTQGKTSKQASEEAFQAFQKYQEVEKQVEEQEEERFAEEFNQQEGYSQEEKPLVGNFQVVFFRKNPYSHKRKENN